MQKWLVGIDEAGRGPLAGPVAVGAACIPHDFDWRLLPGVNDSKQLSEQKREALYRNALKLRREGVLDFKVALVSNTVIDSRGITHAVRMGILRTLRGLSVDPKETFVKLDGLLHAPPEFEHQETIIKGDAKEKVIGLASIVAKVTRDRYMMRISDRYPEYDFETHKGYGTKSHCASIRTYGLSGLHRATFCRNLQRGDSLIR